LQEAQIYFLFGVNMAKHGFYQIYVSIL